MAVKWKLTTTNKNEVQSSLPGKGTENVWLLPFKHELIIADSGMTVNGVYQNRYELIHGVYRKSQKLIAPLFMIIARSVDNFHIRLAIEVGLLSKCTIDPESRSSIDLGDIVDEYVSSEEWELINSPIDKYLYDAAVKVTEEKRFLVRQERSDE